jgi:pyruvate dehydrogenase E2 component (dihydrolipoamide acetyltransferase)
MRRAIARRLSESKATVPHFYMAAECVADELLELRAQVNETAPVKVSVNDFVVAAAEARQLRPKNRNKFSTSFCIFFHT